MRVNFVTVDESAHIPSGLSHWHTGTYCAYRVNPPLPRMLAVLPTLCLRPVVSYGFIDEAPGHRCEGALGRQFAEQNTARYLALVFSARLVGILWSLLGGWIVFRWTRDLFGTPGALLSLGLWCFEPTILGHAQLATADVPAAAAGVAASYAFWRYLNRPSTERAFVSGIVLGVAQLTKFTLLVFYPIWAVLFVISIVARRRSSDGLLQSRPRLWHGPMIVGLGLLVINMGYEFRSTCLPLGRLPFVSRTFAGELGGAPFGSRFAGTILGRLPVPLPVDYLLGIDSQRRDFETIGHLRGSYLNGTWRDHGWSYYYLFALAIKLPLASLLLIGAALVLTILGIGSPGRGLRELCVLLPALGILGLVSSQTSFNHHMRYVLPAFPFLLISVGKLGQFFRGSTLPVAAGVSTLGVWAVASSVAVHPHYLSYFNAAAGGPRHGSEYLVDSNIDSGQDLLFLRDWLKDHPEARPVHVAYFGANINPAPFLEADFSLPTQGPHDGPNGQPATAIGQPYPGYFAVSVNFVRGMPFNVSDSQGVFRSVRAGEYSYFQHFEPIATAGYSIFIYHITLDEANRVRRELGLPVLGNAEARNDDPARSAEAGS